MPILHAKCFREVQWAKERQLKESLILTLSSFLNEVEDAKDLKEKLPNIQQKIINMLKENAESLTILPWTISTTQFSVKFTVRGTHGNIDVDLLPTFYFDGTYIYSSYSKNPHKCACSILLVHASKRSWKI